jgi:hypothetical protein
MGRELKSTPSKSTPSKSTPSKSTPSKSTPSKGTPSKDTPSKDTLSEDTPSKKISNCPGCFPHYQPNQLAHVGPSGCLGDWDIIY